MKAILLDIEGTTTPIDFVHKTLFPYAKERVGQFVEKHFGELGDQIIQLTSEHSSDPAYTLPLDPTEPGSVSEYLKFLIDSDRKSTPLKSIQGMIWQAGYESGELKSVIFDDVPVAFDQWKREGKAIAIFSSGSTLAQKLIFKYSDHGDLSNYISAYFDTTTGPKRVAESYSKIVAALSLGPPDVTFISDIPEELEAANEAGLKAILSIRPGNSAVKDRERFVTSSDFTQI